MQKSTMSVKLMLSALLLMSLLKANNGHSCESAFQCSRPVDIVFVVDTSNSIWRAHESDIRTFLKDVTGSFNIGPDLSDSRVGLLTFAIRGRIEFHLNRYQTAAGVLKAIDKMQFPEGDQTNTHLALNLTSNEMFTRYRGARDGVHKTVVVVTDGLSLEPKSTTEIAAAIKRRGIDVFVIGVGKDMRLKELNEMASKPADRFVFPVGNSSGLDSIKTTLAQRICQGPPLQTQKIPQYQVPVSPPFAQQQVLPEAAQRNIWVSENGEVQQRPPLQTQKIPQYQVPVSPPFAQQQVLPEAAQRNIWVSENGEVQQQTPVQRQKVIQYQGPITPPFVQQQSRLPLLTQRIILVSEDDDFQQQTPVQIEEALQYQVPRTPRFEQKQVFPLATQRNTFVSKKAEVQQETPRGFTIPGAMGITT